jgi:hypothetical protein
VRVDAGAGSGRGPTEAGVPTVADSLEIMIGVIKSGSRWSMPRLLEKRNFGSCILLLYTTETTQYVSDMGSDCWSQSKHVLIEV